MRPAKKRRQPPIEADKYMLRTLSYVCLACSLTSPERDLAVVNRCKMFTEIDRAQDLHTGGVWSRMDGSWHNYPQESICIHAHRCRIHGLVKNNSFSFARTIIDNLCWSALPWTKAQQEENRSRGCPFVPGLSACVCIIFQVSVPAYSSSFHVSVHAYVFPCLSTCVCVQFPCLSACVWISMSQHMRMNFHVSAHAYVFPCLSTCVCNF